MGRTLFLCGLTIWAYMSVWFVLALIRKDNSLADVAWGPGFILLAALTLWLRNETAARQLLVSGLVVLWGLRLAAHILSRNRKRGEDFRYADWRARWGRWFVPRSYLQVFMLQGFFLLVIGLPVILVNSCSQTDLGWLDLAGVLVWLAGFLLESVADRELSQFKGNPANKGKILTSGLWKYSRHPNYFGEAVMWWGIFLITLSLKGGWIGLVSPLLITVLLRYVSGVPLLEKRYRGNAEFREYARQTNAFLPWLPKKPRPASGAV
jgi:steroid 5-alpha reductase family enzyme